MCLQYRPNGFTRHHIDIKAAFLNGDLEETIYVSPPEGTENKIRNDKVLRLRKSLYGLKQSPRCVKKCLDAWLETQGLIICSGEPCSYTRRTNF